MNSLSSSEVSYVMSASSGRFFRRVLVALFCLGLGSWAGYHLYLDFNGGDDVAPGSGIAVINKSQNSVRRRPARSFLWRRADQGQELQLKDSVQTADNSAAAISLKTGELIEIGPNSLFVLNNSTDLSLGFLQGTVVVGENGQTFKYETDPATGRMQKIALPASLQTPLPFTDHFARTAHWVIPLDFKWSANDREALAGQVEISQNKDFKNSQRVEATRIRNQHFRAIAEISQEGEWFWRVSSQGRALSQERSFRVLKTFALNPLHPTEGEAVTSIQAKSPLSFSWQPWHGNLSKESRHTIEVADTADFAKVRVASPIDPSLASSQIAGLSFGNYFWRIVSDFGGNREVSETRSFSIRPKRDFVVTLNAPREASIVSIAQRSKVDFTWTPDEFIPDLRYLVEFRYRDAGGVERSFTRESPTNRLAFELPATGQYRWQVQSLAKTLKIGETAPRTFFAVDMPPLEIVKPANREKLFYWAEKLPVTFQWKNPDNAPDISAYRVELSPKADFSEIVFTSDTRQQQLTSPQLQKDGEYFWRVLALNSQKVIAGASPSQEFQYALHPPLEGPSAEARQSSRRPASFNQEAVPSFNIFEDPSPVRLSWPVQEQRRSVQVRLYRREESRRRLVFQSQSSEKELTLPALKPGLYEVILLPIDILNRPGVESAPTAFEITLGAPLRAPRALSAEVQ